MHAALRDELFAAQEAIAVGVPFVEALAGGFRVGLMRGVIVARDFARLRGVELIELRAALVGGGGMRSARQRGEQQSDRGEEGGTHRVMRLQSEVMASIVRPRDDDFIEIKTLLSTGGRGQDHELADVLDRVGPRERT